MKKIIFFISLFLSVIASAQNDAFEDTTAKPAITEIGKPTGKTAEKIMNKDGGTLVSMDGNLELIIPSGALSKKTSISIQPISNTMPNGKGMAYHLEPSGIQFQKPVKLVFHYDPEESEDSMQLLMGIAMQDDKGQWHGLNKFTLDTVAKTISGNINHFSRWATYDQLKLITFDGRTRLKVNDKTVLIINNVFATPAQVIANYRDDLSILIAWKQSPLKTKWWVNGILKGNAEVGTLEWAIKNESVAEFNTYTAPANLPDENPVTIKVDLVDASYIVKGQVKTNLRLKTTILIYDDAYEVKMVSSYDGPSGTLVGNVTYKDTGSFVVSLNGKKPKIIERVNRNSTANLGYRSGRCTITLSKPGRGNIHIIDAQHISVIPATVTQPKTIVITFSRTPVILPVLGFTCPNPDGGPTIGNTAKSNDMAAVMPAFPTTIRFTAVEEEQVIALFGNEYSELYFKCTVKRMDQFD